MTPYETPEFRAFIRSMREQPADDTVRLVCADWLEERGEAERAEFIRVQVELARMDPFGGWECKVCGARPRYEDGFDLGEVEHGKGCYVLHEDGGGSEFVDVAPEFLSLLARVRELWDRGVWKQLALPSPPVCWQGKPWLSEVRRGFIVEITSDAADWITHGDAILALHPVERVTLTTWPGMTPGWPARYDTERSVTNKVAFYTAWRGVEFIMPPRGFGVTDGTGSMPLD